MVEWVQLLPVALEVHKGIRVLVQVLTAPLVIQLPANGLGKPVKDGTRVWFPGFCVGDPNGAPS